MGRIGCNIGDPSKDFGSEPHVEPPPRRMQCGSVYNGKRCDVLLRDDGSPHAGPHLHYPSGLSVLMGERATAWADASSDPAVLEAILSEHADMLYSLGAG